MQVVGTNFLKEAQEEINAMTPAPINTMLEKESREEAIQKRNERRQMVVEAVEPTPGDIFLHTYIYISTCMRVCITIYIHLIYNCFEWNAV